MTASFGPAEEPWGEEFDNAYVGLPAGLSGYDDTLYVNKDEAELMLAGIPPSPGITEWLALTDAQKNQTLRIATLVLDSLNWAGRKCSCEQELQWPRLIKGCPCDINCDQIPQAIRLATAYLAAFMGEQGGFAGITSTANTAIGNTSVNALEPFDTITVGPITLKTKQNVTYGDELTTGIGQIPPFVADLIRPFLNAFGVSQGLVTRRSNARGWGRYIGAPTYTGTMTLRNGMVYPRIGGWVSTLRNC